ncbi:hypothetical protein AGOR_G00103560 [Albula goreensis]|uniref:G-protein coupled receptor family C group 6 member A n=1 Tax=Albula goreensis TaxID=1534307 RepID=A0A8T3DFR3_9TELE|nr:hypothetical protein AGOR_G00103560 [Albula goreensis]
MLAQFHWFALGLCLLLCMGNCCDMSDSICGAHGPGNILIGVLNPCHAKVETLHKRIEREEFNCTHFDLLSFVRTLSVIHTIDTINDSGFLPGVKLGYAICDTCSYATKAIQSAEHLLSINGTLSVQCDFTDHTPVKAIIGARFSEVSITVARLLGLHMVPQISTTSSAEILSDKLRFPSFLRTIPSDVHQTRALAQLMRHFGWEWVGVVAGDDDYGDAALHSFLKDAKEAGVCLAFQEVLPHYLDHVDSERRIKEVVETIRSSTAQVVLLILKSQLVEQLFQEMIKANISKTWIASDAWSMYQPLASMEGINGIGDIFGFTFMTGQNPGFEQFLQNLEPGPGAVNHFIEEYKDLRFGCTPELLQHSACLAKSPQISVHSLKLSSTNPIKHAASLNRRKPMMIFWELLKCNETSCSGENFPPWKLLQELKRVNFTLDQRRFYFDESGNFVNGYDLINWEKDGNKRRFKVVGDYNLIKGGIELNKDGINWANPNNTVPESKCSQSCPAGTVKKVSNISCCFNCTQCEAGTYSDADNQETCLQCPNGMWSERGWTHCRPREQSFFRWEEPYAIVLLTATALGVLLLFVILIIFLVGRKSPAAKVAGGWFCYVMIAGLTVSFGSVVLFIGKPNRYICQARQTMYGLGFTLCLSCILVKSFRTFLAFLFDLNRQHKLRKLYKPVAIIIIATAAQGLICTFWLIFDSPSVEIRLEGMKILMQCKEGSQTGFSIMLSYIALLAFVCFVLALKGRKVPHRFNETGYIIFSVLIYLFVWVCFIPIYVTKIRQRSAVQASAILVSNYGIIFCHFMPKCYMIVCKKKVENSTQAYLEGVRVFSITSMRSAFAHITGDSGVGSSIESVSSRRSMDSETSSASAGSVDTVPVTEVPHVSDSASHLRKRPRRCSI